MQNNYVTPFAVVAILTVAAVVPASSAWAESTSDSLTRIEAETMVLRARDKQLEVQASIVGKQNEIAAKQSMTNVINQTAVVGDPVIRAIEGIGGHMFATLQMSDGSIIDVQQGDTLPSGMKIVSIGEREVVALSGGKKLRLGTYAQFNSGFNPSYPNAGLALPVSQLKGAAR